MLFSGAIFLFFFMPLFFGGYYLLPPKFRNAFALLASLFFYSWGAPTFVVIVVLSALVDYYLAKSSINNPSKNKLIYLGVALNIATLFLFKYFNFFQENVQLLFAKLSLEFGAVMQIALPLGISFLTFQKISFLIDIKRGNATLPKSFVDYLLFVTLFPQLIAGPILRYKTLAVQLADRHANANFENRLSGFYRFVIGLAKKVLIADQIAPLANQAFDISDNPAIYFIGIVAYTVQIYFDFSGYSDMAIGLGRMMDFQFPENFNFPYKSHSVKSFWKRWHITLGQWMQDYLYIPLGGNRVSTTRLYANLWLVFLLSGLWHGASFNFLIWGAWHGFAITLEQRFRVLDKLPNALKIMITFSWVSLGWVWFRAENFMDAITIYKGLFQSLPSLETASKLQLSVLVFAIVFSFSPTAIIAFFYQNSDSIQRFKCLIISLLLVLCIGAIAASGEQPFIYFRF
jgi:alginate O-acetyltransferase complex protein AlgI